MFNPAKNKLSLFFLVLTFTPLLVMRLVVYPITFKTIKEEILENLEIAAHKQSELITQWMEKCATDAQNIAKNPLILLSVQPFDKNTEQGGVLKFAETTHYYDFLWKEYGHKEVFVSDHNGLIRIASRKELIGTNISAKDYFRSAAEGVYFNSKIIPSEVLIENETGMPEVGVPTMFVSVPIIDAEKNITGAVVIRIDVSEINIMMQNIHLGRTGETYLVNAEGYMLTGSRFSEDLKRLQRIKKRSALELKVANPLSGVITKGVSECIKGTDGYDANGYQDYRGVNVLGFWHWMPDYGWGVVAEIDVDEAYGTLYQLRNYVMFVFGMAAVGVIISAFVLGKKISAPISYITEVAEKIADGSHQARVIYTKDDDISKLADAINRIAETLETGLKQKEIH